MLQLTLFEESTRTRFLLIILLALSACDSNQRYIVRSLPAGENREILILADEMAEISRLVYYEVKVGGEIVVPLAHICNDDDPKSLTFKTVSASGGNLVGVYEVTRPDRLIVYTISAAALRGLDECLRILIGKPVAEVLNLWSNSRRIIRIGNSY